MEDRSKPFQIRADLLHLAKEIIQENAFMKINNAESHKKPLAVAPSFTTEDIIKEAEKLYSFVNKK